MLADRPHRDPGRAPVIKGAGQPDEEARSEGVVYIERSSQEVYTEPEIEQVRLTTTLSTSHP